MKLDLVVFAHHRVFQNAVRQMVREEQLFKNHMVLDHISVVRYNNKQLVYIYLHHKNHPLASRLQHTLIYPKTTCMKITTIPV